MSIYQQENIPADELARRMVVATERAGTRRALVENVVVTEFGDD